MTELALVSDPVGDDRPALALSAHGRHFVSVSRGALVVDQVRTAIDDAVDVAVVDREVWCIARGATGHRLERLRLDGERIAAATPLGDLGDEVRITGARRGAHALIAGEHDLELRGGHDGVLALADLGPRGRDHRIFVAGRGVLERRGGSLVLLRAGRTADLSLALSYEQKDSVVVNGAQVLDGAMVVVELVARGQHSILTYDARRGGLLSRVRISEAAVLAFAEHAGVVVIGREQHLALLDLRSGHCHCERVLAAPLRRIAIDAAAERVVVLDARGHLIELGTMLADRRGHAAASSVEPVAEADGGGAAVDRDGAVAGEPAPAVPEGEAALAESDDDDVAPAESSAAAAPHGDIASAGEPVPSDELIDVDGRALEGLGPLPMRHGLAVGELGAYLDDLRAWVTALTRTALAATGASGERSGDAVAQARALDKAASQRMLKWSRRGLPHVEVARDLDLSPRATSLLLLIAAPQIWGELARPYGALAADRARPLVDELLLAHLLEAGTLARSAIAAELDDDAPLVHSGAVIVGSGLRPYAPLSVHPAIARRLTGATMAGKPTTHSLTEIIGPRAELAALVRALVARADAPARVVLRGRHGAGRRSVAAALAAQAGRAIRVVAVEAGANLPTRLRDVALRGDLPCVSLDDLSEDPAVHLEVRRVLDAHRGPLFVRAPLGGELPLSPGYLVVEMPPLTEQQRRDAWRSSLARRGAEVAVGDELAARFQVGPGAIERACSALRDAELRAGAPQLACALAAQVRQHRSARIGSIANRVTRLAAWSDLVASEEIADSLRELVARVKFRRTVLETWGMDQAAATAQGVTALFQGGPGTGKTMAAGVIARELGYELWRVDLSKVVSKWIGETEKNLATVFDAAEEGEVVLLFDEADSLFGKRTEVKSSHDRNANLETNYLLQRLDAFTGIAILTTNFGTAIDAAFKRRLTVQVQFPFPDENERELLWKAHLPPSLPLAPDLDLAAIARRYQMSGGYIRNTALRAAYLAAAERTPIDQGRLERAIKASYRDQAKVATSGRME